MQPIFIAIIQNDIPAFLGLVEERELWLEVRNVEQDNSTVLHMAANHGHGELVSKIIELKRSLIFSRNAHGNTPLHLAALLGDVNTVRTLLEFGSETCSQNNNYQTPLHLVCRSISTEAARIFAEKTRFVSLDELKFALSSGSTFAYRNLRQWNLRQWLEEEMCFFNLSSSGQFSEMKNLNQWKHKFMFYCRYFISVSPRLNFLSNTKKRIDLRLQYERWKHISHCLIRIHKNYDLLRRHNLHIITILR
ncbi:hypothetical protein Bca4012_033053 [Brassica carinata]|uniref:Uncharacterized protein n=2 Tax=Brassica TaxID=3705 RepID=A0A8X7RGE1_BRACI|nr:hypothetical protein Bca52824_046009 [Brassica carinata]CAF1861039.1 unnamed protein product [Brassica napus]